MRLSLSTLALTIASIALATAARADDGDEPKKTPPTDEGFEERRTSSEGDADPGLGSEHRARANVAADLIRAKRFDEADAVADELLAEFEKLMTDPDTVYVVVGDAKQLEAVKALHPDGTKIVWLDIALRQALQHKAFIAVERRDGEKALDWLNEQVERAPFSAEARCERGFLFNRVRRADRALPVYEEAVELARKFEKERPHLGAALRGVGFSLIELGRLDEARAAFQESLRAEPYNELAMSELRYIDALEAKKKEGEKRKLLPPEPGGD